MGKLQDRAFGFTAGRQPDAKVLLTNLGLVLRALRVRYPYLRIVFLSSRTFGGYATTDLNPEPYAYESGFAVKWAIESQINEMGGQPWLQRAGTLNYTKKVAPLVVWGPYMWANGTTRRSDGFFWNREDFEEDGTHPSQSGETKVTGALLDFFKNSPYAGAGSWLPVLSIKHTVGCALAELS